MSIKFARHDRVAQYGIRLGMLLYAAWRGLARTDPKGGHGKRTAPLAVNIPQRVDAGRNSARRSGGTKLAAVQIPARSES